MTHNAERSLRDHKNLQHIHGAEMARKIFPEHWLMKTPEKSSPTFYEQSTMLLPTKRTMKADAQHLFLSHPALAKPASVPNVRYGLWGVAAGRFPPRPTKAQAAGARGGSGGKNHTPSPTSKPRHTGPGKQLCEEPLSTKGQRPHFVHSSYRNAFLPKLSLPMVTKEHPEC